MTITTPKIHEPLAVIAHTDAGEKWAESTDRTPVFSVTRPNPQYVEPYDRVEPINDDGDGETEPYDVPAQLVTAYTMPAKPNAGLALAYLKRARDNADVAMSWLIETAIGSDGYDALVDELAGYDDPADAMALLRAITERVQRVAMGGLDGPKA